MPIVPKFQGQSQIRPSAPVQAFNSSTGRIQGEAIQKFGNDVVQTGFNLQSFFKEAKKDEDVADLNLLNERAKEIALKSADNARVNSSADGTDTHDVYVSDYDEQTTPLLESYTDPVQRKKAESILLSNKNSLSDNVYGEATRRKVNAVKLKNQESLNLAARNVQKDHNTAQGSIDNLENTLSQQAGVYDADQLEIERQRGSKEIAYSSVVGLVDKKEYKTAIQQVDVMSKYLDVETQVALKKNITDAEYTNKNRFLAENERATSAQKEALKNQQDANYGKYYVQYSNEVDPAKKEELRIKMLSDIPAGKLTVSQVNSVIEGGDKSLETRDNALAGSYYKRITDGSPKSLRNIQTEIWRDHKAGALSYNQAEELSKYANIEENKKTSPQSDPYYKEKIKVAEKTLDLANGGFTSQITGDLIFPEGKGIIRNKMQSELMRRVYINNEDPEKASKDIVAKEYGAAKARDLLPPYIVPLASQNNAAGLKSKETKDSILKEVQKKESSGDSKGARELLEKYKSLLKALEAQGE